MIFPDLPSPAEAPIHKRERCQGFARAGNRLSIPDRVEDMLFGIIRYFATGAVSPLIRSPTLAARAASLIT
jgi:hypothetical protein